MKTCWAQYLFWLMILILGSGSALSACGQKGDLYLPDKPAVKKESSANKEPPANSSEEPSS